MKRTPCTVCGKMHVYNDGTCYPCGALKERIERHPDKAIKILLQILDARYTHG
jgi:hypothetical protein